MEAHHLSKFCRNWSIHSGDIVIFLFKWLPLSSWIFEFAKFVGWRCLEVPVASLCKIASKLVVPLQIYSIFQIFKMATTTIIYI